MLQTVIALIVVASLLVALVCLVSRLFGKRDAQGHPKIQFLLFQGASQEYVTALVNSTVDSTQRLHTRRIRVEFWGRYRHFVQFTQEYAERTCSYRSENQDGRVVTFILPNEHIVTAYYRPKMKRSGQ